MLGFKDKCTDIIYDGVDENLFPTYQLPKNQKDALKTTEESKLAKEILGENLHQQFVVSYKQKCISASTPTLP